VPLYLSEITTTTALDARHLCVQTGFILKEVQVPPLPLKAVINTLVDFVEQGERQVFGIAGEVEIDAFLIRVEFKSGITPLVQSFPRHW